MNTPDVNVKFLLVKEVAALLRVSRMTVYRLIHAGDLEAVRVVRCYRIPEQSVTDYLNRRMGSDG